MHKEFAARGLAVLAVNIRQGRGAVSRWVADKGLTVPIVLDVEGTVTDAYRVTGTPTVFLIGRDGRMVAKAVGPRPWLDDKGRALIGALLTGATP